MLSFFKRSKISERVFVLFLIYFPMEDNPKSTWLFSQSKLSLHAAFKRFNGNDPFHLNAACNNNFDCL